jgi:hypothetical protein
MAVRIETTSLAALLTGDTEADRLFRHAFGALHGPAVLALFGEEFQQIEVLERRQGPPAALFLFTNSAGARSRWAARWGPALLAWADRLASPETVLMDFAAIAPPFRGWMPVCFRKAAGELHARGFRHAFTETQWLRQLLLWRRLGWRPCAGPHAGLRERASLLLRGLRSGEPVDFLLGPGESVFLHQEPYYERRRWNVVLASPVVLDFDLAALTARGETP